MSKGSQRGLLWLSDEILEQLDKDKVVIFRDNDNQPYALFKIKDEKGAVVGFGGDNYMVTTEGGDDE